MLGRALIPLCLPLAQPSTASDLPMTLAVMGRPGDNQRPVPVGVIINGQPISDTGLVVLDRGRLFVRQDMLRQWGLQGAVPLQRIEVEGADYALLDGMDGLSAQLDSSGGTLLIDAAPSFFSPTHVGAEQRGRPVMAPVPLQYVGYDLSVARWGRDWAALLLLDAGLSGAWGVAGTTASWAPHALPFSIEFWGAPGDEPVILQVASAYEAVTHHRKPPAAFPALPASSETRTSRAELR